MSQGKYSPHCPNSSKGNEFFRFNCFKQEPAPWTKELEAAGVVYDVKTMFSNYDSKGFDGYGYSAFDAAGNYVGIGEGIDRLGNTEDEYLHMSEDEFASIYQRYLAKNAYPRKLQRPRGFL